MMSQQRFNVLFLTTVAIAFLLQNSAAATTFTVGDAQGWVIPSSSDTYTTWAANKTFVVGDILKFDFATGNHDVTGVSKADFDSCSSANQLFKDATGPASVTLTSAGEKYYICGFSGHCSAGQKLSITVSAEAASSPAPSPSSSPTVAPSPASTTPAAAPAPGSGSASPSPSNAISPASPPPVTPAPASSPPPSATATPPSPSGSARSSVSAMILILAAAVGLFFY